MDEKAQKLAFAAALLKDEKAPLAAGIAVFGQNMAMALKAAAEWPNDPEVVAEKSRLIETVGRRAFLADAETTAADLWRNAQSFLNAGDGRMYSVLMKQYSEVMGFIQKPGTQINNATFGAHVMEVPVSKSDEDWEKEAVIQQQALTNANV